MLKCITRFIKNFDSQRCRNCYKLVKRSEIIEDCDPLACYLRNDTTIVKQCKECYNDSCESRWS